MADITIPKTEYKRLTRQAKAYQEVAARFFTAILRGESVKDVVADFRKTDLYEEAFLRDLEKGLRKSSLGTSE